MFSSYPLARDYGNENVLQRGRDFADARHAEFQSFAKRKDLFAGFVRILNRQVQFVAVHRNFLNAWRLFKCLHPAKSGFRIELQKPRMKVRPAQICRSS